MGDSNQVKHYHAISKHQTLLARTSCHMRSSFLSTLQSEVQLWCDGWRNWHRIRGPFLQARENDLALWFMTRTNDFGMVKFGETWKFELWRYNTYTQPRNRNKFRLIEKIASGTTIGHNLVLFVQETCHPFINKPVEGITTMKRNSSAYFHNMQVALEIGKWRCLRRRRKVSK